MLNSENYVWHKSFAKRNSIRWRHKNNEINQYHLAKLITIIEETKLVEKMTVEKKQELTTRRSLTADFSPFCCSSNESNAMIESFSWDVDKLDVLCVIFRGGMIDRNCNKLEEIVQSKEIENAKR